MTDDKPARIHHQLTRLSGAAKLLGRKEIKELPNILWDDEEILDICQGVYSGGNGILVATQKRLVFVDKGMVWGLKVEDFPLDKVTSIQYETGLLMGTVSIFASGNKAQITHIAPKESARSFAEGVRARLSAKPAVVAAAPPPNATDLTSEIERLGALKERGLLTEEEFTAGKRQLLGL